jgi:hypothetical protein
MKVQVQEQGKVWEPERPAATWRAVKRKNDPNHAIPMHRFVKVAMAWLPPPMRKLKKKRLPLKPLLSGIFGKGSLC